MVLVNVEDPSFLLRDLNMLCYRIGFSLVLSYSVEEAAEYLENFKLSENRNPEIIINNYQQYKQQKQSIGVQINNREKRQQVNNIFIKLK